MPQDEVAANRVTTLRQPQGIRRLVYWMGRMLQGLGLLLVWWVLLAFTGVAQMWPLLFWTMAAALIFYLGWACATWARPRR